MDQTFSVMLEIGDITYTYFQKILWVQNTNTFKLFNKTFSYPFQNKFSSKPNQMNSKYLYSGYQITNGAQLSGTLQMSG